jgi:iron complex outermembrane receptor protein
VASFDEGVGIHLNSQPFYMKITKTTFLLIFFTLFFTTIQAQDFVIVKGLVWDIENDTELPAATVSAVNLKSRELVGTKTNLEGYFSMKLKPGLYQFKISFVGYQNLILDSIKVSKDSLQINLGKIEVGSNTKLLNTATVRGEKAEMIMDVDKKIFNVEDNAMTIGGTALDVLNQLPTVDVDVDGNVSLRGSSDVLIYINGKQSGLSGVSPQAILQQIPSANIERVEIINNPSAKYDAEGTSGIINIILKKGGKEGWNALVTGGVGSNNKYNGSVTYSYVKNKFTVSATYGYRDNQNWSRGNSERYNFFADTGFYINQDSERDRRSISNTLNGSVDYRVTPKSTISFNWLGNLDYRTGDEIVNFEFLTQNQELNRKYDRLADERQNGVSGELGASFMHKFNNKGHEVFASANFSSSDRLEKSVFSQDLLGKDRQLQRTDNGTKNFLPVFQLDYTRPAKHDIVWEVGAKFTMRDLDDYFISDTFDYSLEEHITHLGLTNSFVYTEIVNATYFNFAKGFKYFKFKGGLRAEQTLVDGRQKVGNIPVTNNYFNIFPSVFVNRQISKGQDVQMGYSRRIKRPGLRTLNPFAEQTDPLNLRVGNPLLRPEYIDAYEVTYFKTKRGDFISGTVYYRQENDITQRVREVNESGVAVMSWYNLDVSRNVGLEGIVRKKFKGVNNTLNLNLFRNQVVGNALNTDFAAINLSWFAKYLMSTKLTDKIDLQATYFYRGKITYVQGTIDPMHNLDIALKWKVLNDNGNFSINLTDVFNTKQFAIDNEGINFTGSFLRKWETRILTVNFTYKLGNLNVDWEKRNRSSRGEGGGGGDMDF